METLELKQEVVETKKRQRIGITVYPSSDGLHKFETVKEWKNYEKFLVKKAEVSELFYLALLEISELNSELTTKVINTLLNNSKIINILNK